MELKSLLPDMTKYFVQIAGHHGPNGVLVLLLVKLEYKNLIEFDAAKNLKLLG